MHVAVLPEHAACGRETRVSHHFHVSHQTTSFLDTFQPCKKCKNRPHFTNWTDPGRELDLAQGLSPTLGGEAPRRLPVMLPSLRFPPRAPKTHPRPPARALGDPADFGVADGAADPVTAVLLLHHDAALWAVHGLALLQHGLGHGRCQPSAGLGRLPAGALPDPWPTAGTNRLALWGCGVTLLRSSAFCRRAPRCSPPDRLS